MQSETLTTSNGIQVMAGFFGENFQGLSRTEKLGAIAVLMQVVYLCEENDNWTLRDELSNNWYRNLSPELKDAILAFDEDDQGDAIAFCTALLLKLAMEQSR